MGGGQGERKGQSLVLNASFTCGTAYESWSPAQQGLDVETWVKMERLTAYPTEALNLKLSEVHGRPLWCGNRWQ